MRKRAFTLIEMMIIVAIIAILFTIVLTQVGKAKQTAQLSALREGLSTFRTEAQTYARGQNDSFDGLCSDGAKPYAYLMQMLKRVRSQATDLQSEGITCKSNAASYAVDINGLLASYDLNETLCVDGTGYKGIGKVDASSSFITCEQ